jgi:hypothetical protein
LKNRIYVIIIWLFLTGILKSYSQDLEPRAYTNIPVGMNFVLAGYAYSQGGVVFDPAVPLENANIKIHSTLFAFARSLNIFGLSGKFDMIVPYGWLSGSADFNGDKVYRDVAGFADPRLRLSVNFIGAPALTLPEFMNYKQNFVLGAALQVYLPLSQYDPERLVNIGTNRFTIKPELGMSKRVGPLQIEMTGGVAFYTDNNDFYGGKTRSQAHIGSVQGHLTYNFKNGIWAALDGTYYWGGHTTVDGVEGNDLQKNTRGGLTVAFPMSIHHSVKLNLSTGVSTRTGSDYDVAGIIWQYRWGKSLPKAVKTN